MLYLKYTCHHERTCTCTGDAFLITRRVYVYVSEAATKSLVTVAYGVIAGIPVPFPLADPDACDHGVKCPVKPGVTNVYSEQYYLEEDFPIVSDVTALLQ